MVSRKDVKAIGQEVDNLRIGILQLLCLDKLYEEKAHKEDRCVITTIGKELISHDEKESLQI